MSGSRVDQGVQHAADGVEWSVCAIDADTHEPLLDEASELVLRAASIGKLALLIEVARRLDTGEWDASTLLSRSDVDPVTDSGLWQHLRTDELPLADVAALVGAVSDNLATNVLLNRAGLDSVAATGRAVGLGTVQLYDIVRNSRRPEHAPTLSTGSAADLASLFARLHLGDIVSPAVSRQVLDWLAPGSDLSMAASVFDLDPLAHVAADRGLLLRNKTGTDAGVRADAGLVVLDGRAIAYAVIANWDAGSEEPRESVMARMRALGAQIEVLVRR